MASSKIIFSVVLLMISISIVYGDEDLISSTCRHTLYYQECVASLRSDPHSKTAALNGLAFIAINVSTAFGAQTLALIIELKSNASSSVVDPLNDCIELYGDAVEALQRATTALKNRSFNDFNTFVSAAMTYSDTCEDGFEKVKQNNNGSPIFDKNLYFNKLCSNSLSISTLLH